MAQFAFANKIPTLTNVAKSISSYGIISYLAKLVLLVQKAYKHIGPFVELLWEEVACFHS